jgi:hypothetical protein
MADNKIDWDFRRKLDNAYEIIRRTWCLSEEDVDELYIGEGLMSERFDNIRREWGFFEALMAIPASERYMLMEYANDHLATKKEDQ